VAVWGGVVWCCNPGVWTHPRPSMHTLAVINTETISFFILLFYFMPSHKSQHSAASSCRRKHLNENALRSANTEERAGWERRKGDRTCSSSSKYDTKC